MVLREFRKRFRRKRPALLKSAQWHFHQDNTPVHNSILVTDYQDGHQTVPHPPYRPDLAPCDFWLFPKLRGCRYETTQEMKVTVTKVIQTPTQEDFHRAFQKLLERYSKCITPGGDYFKGDLSFICLLLIKVPIRKKSRNLSYAPHTYSPAHSYKDKYEHSLKYLIMHRLLQVRKPLYEYTTQTLWYIHSCRYAHTHTHAHTQAHAWTHIQTLTHAHLCWHTLIHKHKPTCTLAHGCIHI